VFDGEVSRAWCAFVEGLVGSQSVVGVAEQVDFDGEGGAVAEPVTNDQGLTAATGDRPLTCCY